MICKRWSKSAGGRFRQYPIATTFMPPRFEVTNCDFKTYGGRIPAGFGKFGVKTAGVLTYKITPHPLPLSRAGEGCPAVAGRGEVSQNYR